MTKQIEDKLDKIPLINLLVRFFKQIKLPGFEGLSIYDLLELYGLGIVKGTLTTRASVIAFSFFTSIFPFLLFVVIGAAASMKSIWDFSDAMIFAMVFPNMVGLYFLFPVVKKQLKRYTDAIKAIKA